MSLGAARHDRDYWLGHVQFGVRLQLLLAALCLPYAAFGSDTTRRGALVGTFVFAAVAGAGVRLLPWTRIIEAGRVMRWLHLWSVGAVGLVSATVWFDGGVDSPLTVMYALPLLYAAIAYPPRSVILLGCLMAGIVATMGLLSGPVATARLWIVATLLMLCSATYVRVASNHRQSWNSQVQLSRRLHELAHVDGLTGCMNHRAFREHLATSAAEAIRSGTTFTLIAADLDHFKQVNDAHGHRVGDRLLAAVGRTMIDAVRTQDSVARVGGEEFMMLLPECDAPAAEEIAERIRRMVGGITDPVAITVSAGIATFPTHADTVDELVDLADRTLYAAKARGRDCVAVHRQATQPSGARGVDRRIEQMLADDQLYAALQPILDLTTGAVVGMEALARIRDSKLRPDQWLDLADAAGLRASVEVAMFEAALTAFAEADLAPDTLLFVNMSPDVLLSGTIWSHRDELPDTLVIELSERSPVDNYDTLAETMGEMRRLGLRFAIDDVGAGHANMRHIMELQPDFMKLDRSLCADVDRHPQQTALVAALTGFAKDAGIHLIGEGIERQAEATTLHGVGVRLGQGYLFARPEWPAPSPIWPGLGPIVSSQVDTAEAA